MVTNRLMRKTGLYLIGNVSSKLIQALLIPVYAYLVTPTALGSYDYYLTIASIITMVVFCAIWESVLRFRILATDRLVRDRLASTVLGFWAFATCVFIAGSLVAGFALVAARPAIIWVTWMSLAYGTATIWQYFARADGEVTRYIFAGVASMVASLGLTLALVWGGGLQVEGLALAYVGSQLIIVAIIEHKLSLLRSFRVRLFDRRLLFRMLKFSSPLIISLASMFLLTGFGRLLITQNIGAAANGQYVFAMKFSTLITALGTVFSMASLEESLARVGTGSLPSYFSSLVGSVCRVAISAAGITMVPVFVFYLIIGDTEYRESFVLVGPFLLFGAFHIMATNVSAVFHATSTTRFSALTTVIGLVVTVTFSLLTIAPFGPLGVAWSLVAGMFVVFAVRLRIARAIIGFQVPTLRILVLLLWSAGVSIIFVIGGPSVSWLTLLASALGMLLAFPLLVGLKGIRSISDVAASAGGEVE